MTNDTRINRWTCLCSVSLALFIAACGASSGGANGTDVGTGTGNAVDDALTTLTNVNIVVSTSLMVGTPARRSAISQHVHCRAGTRASVSGNMDGTSSSGSYSLAASMDGCNSTNGNISYAGTYAGQGANSAYSSALTGTAYGNGCTVTLAALTYTFSVPTGTIITPTSESISGGLSAFCAEGGSTLSVTCTWPNSVSATSLSSLKSGCSSMTQR